MTNFRLPGDLSPKEFMAQLLRVDHAGEYGAKYIYEGQLKVIKDPQARQKIQHMAEQEQEHLDFFDEQLVKHRVRPSLLAPLWRNGGRLMGAATALLGANTAMACTEAVEEVIDNHYQEQLEQLPDTKEYAKLKAKISKFRDDEVEHRQTALDSGAEQAPLHNVLTWGIKIVTRLAIEVAKKV
ncbi:MAG: demethoxyubiquinone hydroxylase family protein [Pseudomonadota bacterium]